MHESPVDFFAACTAKEPAVLWYSKVIAIWTHALIALLASEVRAQAMGFQQKDLQSCFWYFTEMWIDFIMFGFKWISNFISDVYFFASFQILFSGLLFFSHMPTKVMDL